MSTDELSQAELAEFFHENQEMLGFSSKGRALVMSIKEAVDNSLDSAEEIGVCPEIDIWVAKEGNGLVRIVVSDNGSGIDPADIKDVFGSFLYSSRFGRLRQTRGQQGIGISAVHLYSQREVGEPTRIRTRRPGDGMSTEMKLISRRKGKEVEVVEREAKPWSRDHGTEFEVVIPANYRSHGRLEEYLEGTLLANPSLTLRYRRDGEMYLERERVSDELPELPPAMKPHPKSATIGGLQDLVDDTKSRTLSGFLQNEFVRMSQSRAEEVCEKANQDPERGLRLRQSDYQGLVQAVNKVDFYAPPDDPLNPLGEEQIRTTLERFNPEYVGVEERDVIGVNGHPVIIEAGIAYGGDIQHKDPIPVYRVANRVPLVYRGGECALQKSVENVGWDNYELTENNGLPSGPAIMFVHACSTQIPFESEDKTFVAPVPDLMGEVKNALRACGRNFSKFVRKQRQRRERKEKVEDLQPIYRDMQSKLSSILGKELDDDPVNQALAKACSTVLVERNGEGYIARNPTDESIKLTVNGEDTDVKPGDKFQIDSPDDITAREFPVVIE